MFACPHVQSSGSLQDLPAGLDSTVTSAHVLSQPRGKVTVLCYYEHFKKM